MRSALVPAVLLVGIGLSVASSGGPVERDFMNESLERGPTVTLEPGQIARFRMHFVAPTDLDEGNSLWLEALERPSAAAADTASETGLIDSASNADTAADSSSFSDTAAPVSTSNLHVRLLVGDQVVEEGDPIINEFQQTSNLRWFGILDACRHLGSNNWAADWQQDEMGQCEGEMTVELSVRTPMTVFWGARLQARDTWVRCDEDGQPVGCGEEEPDSTVLLEILPA